MSEEFENDIYVSIPGVRRQNFRTIAQVKEWHQAELDTWNEFWQQISSSDAFNMEPNVVNGARNQLNQIAEYIRQYEQSSDQDQRKNACDLLAAQIEKYAERPLITSETELSAIIDLAKEDPDSAKFKFARLAGQTIQPGQIQDMIRFSQVASTVAAYDIDPKKAVASQKQSLTKLRQSWSDALEENHSDFQKTLAALRWDKRRLKGVVLNLARKYKKEQIDHEERMAAMEKAFSTDMELKAAEKFWSNKRRINRRREETAKTRLFYGLGIVAVALVLLYSLVGWLAPKDNTPLIIFLCLIPTVLAVWPLRVLANQVRTNKDMADDAEEREAMVYTFKALEFENRVGNDERLVILSALFRPHERAAEESVPHPVMEMVLKRLGSNQ